jgi:HlyD family secretion protein
MNIFTKFVLPAIALGLLVFAVIHVTEAQRPIPKLPPPIQPAKNPFSNTVAGAGMVEPETENIAMGSPVPGVVVEVMAKVGKKVKAGDPLFRLDDRELKAELNVRKAMLEDAKAKLEKLEQMPRQEELPPAEARVRETEAEYADLREQVMRGEKMFGKKAMSEEEFMTRKQQAIQSRERRAKALADYDLLKAGAWQPEKRMAQTTIDHVQMQVNQIATELERLVIRALVDAEVLQVNVRPGEFVGAPADQALVVLGNVTQLHVRVDIDEYDIPRFSTSAQARATLKGQPDVSFPLRFVRVEPFVIPKKSLTGDNTERVDTRVLQVIYAIDAGDQRLFVGQQLDVFIDAGTPKTALTVAQP